SRRRKAAASNSVVSVMVVAVVVVAVVGATSVAKGNGKASRLTSLPQHRVSPRQAATPGWWNRGEYAQDFTPEGHDDCPNPRRPPYRRRPARRAESQGR